MEGVHEAFLWHAGYPKALVSVNKQTVYYTLQNKICLLEHVWTENKSMTFYITSSYSTP
jgi:hypothetical protein